jgi:hypothetical protein
VGGASPHLANCQTTGYGIDDPTPGSPSTPKALASDAWRVVIADAVDQRPFWLPNSPWGLQGNDKWQSFTATNFHVVRVIKGKATPWLQRYQEGAVPGSLPCPGAITFAPSQPPPKVGTRYLLFDDGGPMQVRWGSDRNPQHADVPGLPDQDQGGQGAWFRFVVIDGMVHSEGEFNHDVESMRITPQPLDAFLRSIGL